VKRREGEELKKSERIAEKVLTGGEKAVRYNVRLLAALALPTGGGRMRGA
jgi:hypothetical protein